MSASVSPSEAPAEAPEPPRRPRWRVLRVVGWLAGLVLLPPLLLAAGLLAANTAPGRAAIERLAATLVPGLVLEGLEGPLPGRPGFARLTLADDQGIGWRSKTPALSGPRAPCCAAKRMSKR